MDSLFGEEFDLEFAGKTSKSTAKKLLDKIDAVAKSDADIGKILESSKVSMEERLNVITSKVLEILGRQRDNVLVIRKAEDLSLYIDKAVKAGRIDVDTETNNSTDPATCKIVGLCLYVPGEKQVYVPINHVNYKTKERLPWQLTEEDCRAQLQRLLDAKLYIIMHNGKFDFEVLYKTCGIELPPNWDTIIAARLVDENKYSEKATSLKWIYTTEIDPTQTKYDIESLFENVPYEYVDPEIFALYAATDSMMTDKVYEWEQPYFEGKKNERLKWLLDEIETPIVALTAKMELRGVCVDLEFGEKLKAKYNKQLEDLDAEIGEELIKLKPMIDDWRLSPEANETTKAYVPKKSKMSPEKIEEYYDKIDKDGRRYKETKPKAEQLKDPINLGSPVQLAILFYDVLKCPQVSKKSPRGTGEEELEAIAEQTNYAICKLIVKRRGITKLITTYIDVIPELAKHWPDHRVRFKLNSMGTDTGRYSSGGKWKFLVNDKATEISGINIQNIPSHNKEIRMLFKAKEDFGQIEEKDNIFEIPEITEVETPNGWMFCKDLAIGDKLLTDDGEVKCINNIIYRDKVYYLYV